MCLIRQPQTKQHDSTIVEHNTAYMSAGGVTATVWCVNQGHHRQPPSASPGSSRCAAPRCKSIQSFCSLDPAVSTSISRDQRSHPAGASRRVRSSDGWRPFPDVDSDLMIKDIFCYWDTHHRKCWYPAMLARFDNISVRMAFCYVWFDLCCSASGGRIWSGL